RCVGPRGARCRYAPGSVVQAGSGGSPLRRRPRAPFRGPIPALAARRGQARTEDSPARSTAASGTGGPRPPPRGRAGAEGQCTPARHKAKSGRWGAVKLSAEAGSHLHPRALPSRPRAGRGAPQPEEVRPAEAEPDRAAVPRGDPTRTGRAHRSRRGVSPRRTARTPSVYLLTVSRPLELSLQSSFQLSLTVLVDYRSRAGIYP